MISVSESLGVTRYTVFALAKNQADYKATELFEGSSECIKWFSQANYKDKALIVAGVSLTDDDENMPESLQRRVCMFSMEQK